LFCHNFLVVFLRLPVTVSGLAKVAIFTIPKAFGIDVENQTLINHKCVCGALNRHFCQTRVMPSLLFSAVQNLFAYAIH
jgi:hypothetical protein